MTTNRKRWVVWRDNALAINWINPWVAAARDPSDYGYTGKFFPTHAEALAYADRMARTVEVTLPRIGSQFTCKQRETPSYDDITLTKVNSNNYQIRYAEDMGEDGRGIDMLADELQPVALALLAHHYRQEAQ